MSELSVDELLVILAAVLAVPIGIVVGLGLWFEGRQESRESGGRGADGT